MKKRGGYAGNLKRQIKIRVSEELYGKINRISEEKQISNAWIIREFISSCLALRANESEPASKTPNA
jgi:predicted DNA-binding protein